MDKHVCLVVNCMYDQGFIVGYMENYLLGEKWTINNLVFQPICCKYGTPFTHGKWSFFAVVILLSSGLVNILIIHAIV